MNIFKSALAVAFFLLCATVSFAQSSLTLREGQGERVTLSRDAASVYVANPGIADVQVSSNRTIFVSAIGPGRTTVIATDFEGKGIVTLNVRVLADTDEAATVLDNDLRVGSAGNVAVIRGRTNSVAAARTIPSARDILSSGGRVVQDTAEFSGANQITLRVRFVEASRDDLRNIGLNLAAFSNVGDTTFRIATGMFDATKAATSPGVGIRSVSGDTTLEGLLSALDSRNIINILSEPTLTTVSGKRATFTAGGELGFPVAQADGVVTTEFKQYGINLSFLPVLLPNGRIAINVQPEVSFLDASAPVKVNGFSAPSVSVRRADTTVEVGDGQTFAIAGLYEQYDKNGRAGVPGLTKVLGNRESRNRESELIMFVTAYLTNPIDATKAQPRVNIADTVGFITK